VASLGTLNLVLSADSSPLRKELSGVTREAQFVAKAIQGISTGESFSGAGLQVLSSTIIGLVDDTHRLGNEFKLTTSLVENLKNGIGGLAALPIPDFQAEALSSLGLGQVSSSLEVLSLASTGLKTLAIAQGIAQGAIVAFSGALETLRVNLKLVSYFLEDIASSLRAAGAAFAPFASLAEGAGRAFDRLSNGAGDAKKGIDSAWVSVGQFGQQLQKYIGAAETFQSAMEDLGDAAILFNQWKNISDIVDGVFGGIEENFNAARQFESLNNRLELTSTSAGGAKEDLDFLRQTADDLGLDFKALSEGFAQFSAAATLAGFDADKTSQTFTDVAQAASVMGLSAEETSGLFLALRQSLSGGTVQLEELNQLSERIPGALDAAAQALGVTSGEVKGLISAGDVASADFIPKFAAALASVTQSGVTDAMTSGTAAVNRFNNALGEVSVALGKDLLDIGTPAIEALAKALEFGANNAALFGTAIDAILVASALRGAGAVGKMGTVLAGFISQGGKGSIAMELFGKQISVTVGQIGKLAAQAGLAYVALTLFYEILDITKDGGAEVRESIDSLDHSLLKLSETTRNVPDMARIFPDKPPPTSWIDGLKHRFNDFNTFLNTSVGLPDDFLALPTNSEKQIEDQLQAAAEFGQRVQDVLKQSLDLRTQTQAGGGAINELKQIDAMLAQIEKRKLAVDPKDADALAAIRKEEEALLDRRAAAQRQVQQTQAANDNAVTQAKQQLAALEALAQDKGIDEERYTRLKQQFEAALTQAEQEKAALDGLASTTTKVAENAVTDFQKSNHEIEASYNQRQAAIAESLAKNEITEEQSREQSLQAEQEYLQKRLELNQSLLEKLRTELEKNQQLKLRDPDDAILTADQEKQYAEQVKQLELETAQTRIQIAQNTREGKQQALEDELKGIEQANSEAEAAVRQSQSERTAAIRQQQLAGTVGEEEAAAKIAEIQRDSIAEQIDLERDKLAQLAELEAAGTIPAEEAAKRRLDIQSEISDLSLQQIEAELDARLEAERKAADEAKELRDSVNIDATRETTQVRVRQAGGEINEAEAAAEIAEITANATARQIELVEQRLGVVRRGSDEEKDLTRELADLQQQSAEQEIARQEQVKQARLEAIERANQQAEAAIDQGETAEITAIRELQAQRVISAEEAETRIAAMRQRTVALQIALTESEIEQVRQLRAEGVLSEEEAIERLSDLSGELGELNQQRVENEIDAQERLKQARLDAMESANRQAEAAIDQSQTTGVTAIKSLQAQRIISEEEATEEIAALQQEALDQQIAQTQEQIAEIQQLRSEGILSEEEATDRLIDLNGELGDLNEERIDAEIDSQERLRESRIKSLNEELDFKRKSAEADQGLNQIAIDSIKNENNLLSAQSSLLEAQSGLAEQRLQYALEDAETAGNSAQADQIRQQILSQQTVAQEKQFAIARQQLELKREQVALESQQRQIQADIAITEAEVALSTAAINGENQQVIAGLERILDLRRQQRKAVNDQNRAQERSLELEQQTLTTQQQQTREQQARQRAQSNNRNSGSGSGSGDQPGSGSGSSGGSRSSGSSFGSRSGLAPSRSLVSRESLVAAMGAGSMPANFSYGGIGGSRTQQAEWRTPEWSDGRSTPVQSPSAASTMAASRQLSPLQLQGLSQVGLQRNAQANRAAQPQTTGTLTASQFNSGINQLSQRIVQLANAPRAVTLQTPEPVRDYQRISSDLMSSRARAAGI